MDKDPLLLGLRNVYAGHALCGLLAAEQKSGTTYNQSDYVERAFAIANAMAEYVREEYEEAKNG